MTCLAKLWLLWCEGIGKFLGRRTGLEDLGGVGYRRNSPDINFGSVSNLGGLWGSATGVATSISTVLAGVVRITARSSESTTYKTLPYEYSQLKCLAGRFQGLEIGCIRGGLEIDLW